MLTGQERPLYEGEYDIEDPDPQKVPIKDRRLITQPYDLVITALIDQIRAETLHLRPLSSRPKFQRRYVWSDQLAARLIESMMLNVPIPPCYLSQDRDYQLDVIDGQQRIYSIYRFLDNQFALANLEILTELNGKRFFELPERDQRKLSTYTLRCVIITNDSHPEIRFDVFERLNTNTVPLNAQELRNSVYRGAMIDLLPELAEHKPWLEILNRKNPDKRMRDEELILRFFAFYIGGIDSYRTPQKHWLNEVADKGRKLDPMRIIELGNVWKGTIDKCLAIFSPLECFRRLPVGKRGTVVNRALMDLTMTSLVGFEVNTVTRLRKEFYERYLSVLRDEEFGDLITRATDHKSRTLRRFEIWRDRVVEGIV